MGFPGENTFLNESKRLMPPRNRRTIHSSAYLVQYPAQKRVMASFFLPSTRRESWRKAVNFLESKTGKFHGTIKKELYYRLTIGFPTFLLSISLSLAGKSFTSAGWKLLPSSDLKVYIARDNYRNSNSPVAIDFIHLVYLERVSVRNCAFNGPTFFEIHSFHCGSLVP